MRLKRYFQRLYFKIVREKATAEYIARGWAIGMFYGCLIPFGFQLACSIPTAFLMRGSKIGATLGTLLTNHVTIFFIYPAQCWVGNKLIGGDLTHAAIKEALRNVLHEQSYDALLKIGGHLVTSFFVGGALLTAIMTPITYFAVKALVVKYRALREARIRRRKTTPQA